MAGAGDDADLAFQLQLAEAIRLSLDSSDAAYAHACQVRSAASVRVTAHDALFARELAAISEDQWAHDGDYFERPLGSEPSPRPLFRVFFKGLASKNVVGPRDRDPGVAVLAVAVCGPRGEVVLRVQKPVEGFVGGREVLEAMALLEGLDAALTLGIRSVKVISSYRVLHNHIHGIWHITQKKVANMVNQVLSVKRKFEQCEILLVPQNDVGYVIKLARDSIDALIAKALAVDISKEKRETCAICLEDADVSKIHVVEDCTHRFCFSCMKEHVKVKLLHGMLPACPHDGCTTKLRVENSKKLLTPQLLEIMVERIKEGQIPPTQKIYCPYPKCSALMSLSDLIDPMQESCSKYTVADAATLRKCLRCRGPFCIGCKVPWHDGMTCYNYMWLHPLAHPEDARLQNLAQQRLWRQCVRCKHMIELAEGCFHITCVCGCEFCYTCGKEWKENKATCTCPLWEERNIIRGNYYYDEEEDDYYDEDDDDNLEGRGILHNRVLQAL